MSGNYGTTIFCDDIREEVGGKKTYVGIYLQDMIVHSEFPVVIPQFSIAVTYVEPIESDILPVKVSIFIPDENGDDASAFDVDLPEDRGPRLGTLDGDTAVTQRVNSLFFKVSPLILTTEGRIKVRAYRGGEEMRLGSLRIRKATAEEAALSQ